MFTGIIKEIGKVKKIIPDGNGRIFFFTAQCITPSLKNGDSVAVNGVCLTVTQVDSGMFTCTAMEETLSRTTLSKLRTGDFVNLEPALRMGDSLGGHWVQGHVDGIGICRRIIKQGSTHQLELELPDGLLRYIVEKGSIAVDGVSLTIAGIRNKIITIFLIPYTFQSTIFQYKRPGDLMNVEVDILGKYIEKFLNSMHKSKG